MAADISLRVTLTAEGTITLLNDSHYDLRFFYQDNRKCLLCLNKSKRKYTAETVKILKCLSEDATMYIVPGETKIVYSDCLRVEPRRELGCMNPDNFD